MGEEQSPRDKPRDVGLNAIRVVRLERERSKHGRLTGKAWLVALGAIVSVIAIALLLRDRTLSNQKEELLAKQRAALATVGAEWHPLRDRMEKLTLDAAGPYRGDFIDPEAATWDFRSAPGIYLRLRVEDAKDIAASERANAAAEAAGGVESLRKKAKDSARDSFVGCLLKENNPSAAAIARGDADAGTGWHDQPWNLRLAYHATRILTNDWVNEIKNADDEIHLRVFVHQYEASMKEEIPLAIDIVKRASFFLLVLDEDVPEAMALTSDAGHNAGKVTEEQLQQVAHPTRVHIVNLKTGVEMVRLRREASAEFRFAGEHTVRDPYVLAAMKRQVNNCALAQTVWAAIRPQGNAKDAGADAQP